MALWDVPGFEELVHILHIVHVVVGLPVGGGQRSEFVPTETQSPSCSEVKGQTPPLSKSYCDHALMTKETLCFPECFIPPSSTGGLESVPPTSGDRRVRPGLVTSQHRDTQPLTHRRAVQSPTSPTPRARLWEEPVGSLRVLRVLPTVQRRALNVLCSFKSSSEVNVLIPHFINSLVFMV